MIQNPGYIYILTNPAFPDYVKIGYAEDVEQKLTELNRYECVPFPFRLYATYLVDAPMTDSMVHSCLDKINPHLHSIHTFANQEIPSAFYAMSPEEAYSILEAIALFSGTQRKLSKTMPTFEEIEKPKKRVTPRPPFRFSMCNIQPGEFIEFWNSKSENCGVKCRVLDDKHVEYDNKSWSLSALATELSNAKWSLQGPLYFRYKGESLNELRERLEKEKNIEEIEPELSSQPFNQESELVSDEEFWTEITEEIE